MNMNSSNDQKTKVTMHPQPANHKVIHHSPINLPAPRHWSITETASQSTTPGD